MVHSDKLCQNLFWSQGVQHPLLSPCHQSHDSNLKYHVSCVEWESEAQLIEYATGS